MAETMLQASFALAGRCSRSAAVQIVPIEGLSWAAITVRRGARAALAARMQAAFGLTLPDGPGVRFARPLGSPAGGLPASPPTRTLPTGVLPTGVLPTGALTTGVLRDSGLSASLPTSLLWAGPDRFTLLHQGVPPADPAQAVGDAGYVTDLTGSQVTLGIEGEGARLLLGRLVAIDLHPRNFGPGSAAATLLGHFGVTLWQTSDAPAYCLASYRSFAEPLWHAVTLAAAGL